MSTKDAKFTVFNCGKCNKPMGACPPGWPVPNQTIVYCLTCTEKLQVNWYK